MSKDSLFEFLRVQVKGKIIHYILIIKTANYL